MSGADAAFDVLSDPIRLPEYVPTMRLVDSTAIEGEADADAGPELAERDGAPEAGFIADRKTRSMSWGRPDHDYGGSISVAAGTTGTADVTVRLHTRADVDAEEVARIFDQAVSNIRRILFQR
jgi:hypothetical protein